MVELGKPEAVLAPALPLWAMEEVPQLMAVVVVPVGTQAVVVAVVVEALVLAFQEATAAEVVEEVVAAMEPIVYLALMARVPILLIGIVLREAVVLG